MPELPEVEIARRQLDRWGTGRTIRDVILLDPGAARERLTSRPSDASAAAAERLHALVGEIPERPLRRGKRIGWPIGPLGILVHLGMTGHWVRRDLDPPRHARLGLEVDDGVLWFLDARRFGCVVPVDRDQLDRRLGEGLGPDALDALPPPDDLAERFRTRGPIKPALLDQTRIAGIGNIQAIESLWRAGIAPTRPTSSLTPEEWARLAEAIGVQLRATIAHSDGDEIHYTNLGGPNPFHLYGREGEPCPRCGAAITRTILGGRATYHCPSCQRA